MRRVFLIISLLCLLPFTMMAQTKISSYDEKLGQSFGRSPYGQELPRDASNEGDDWTIAPNFGYGFIGNSMVKFDPADPQQTPSTVKQFGGYAAFVSAEIVAYNSTTDYVYAYTEDGKFCKIDPQTKEIQVVGTITGGPMSELAYDVTTKTMYGLRYGVLYEISLEDGSGVAINETQSGFNNWIALAIDNEGNMYGIMNTNSLTTATLYKIHANPWYSMAIGTLDYSTMGGQTMAFDRNQGKLYWWQNYGSSDFTFTEINPVDASCTPLWISNPYNLLGMFFHYSAKQYPITYETVENGAFSGPASAAENDVVTIIVTPADGYRLGSLNWNGNEIDITTGDYSFTMIPEPVTVSGTFLLSLHNIIVLDPKDGTLATVPANEATYLVDNVQVVPTPDPGFGVESISYTSDCGSGSFTAEPYEFPMVDCDVTVSAVYTQTGVNTISIATDYYGYFDDIVTVAVAMDNENLVAGTQMDIALGENLTFVDGSLQLSERAAGEGWEISGAIQSGNVLRVTTFNTATTPYTGNTGTIFTFQVKCGRVAGNNVLAISGVVAGTPDATQLTVADVDGALEIKDVTMTVTPAEQVVCHNAESTPVVFSTDIPTSEGPITYAWTNDNTTIGLDASGNGDIAAFTATNTGLAQVVANLTVTPTLVHNGNACVGSTQEFTISVNPQVIMNTPENQVVCNGATTTDIALTTTLTDGEMSYAWEGGSAIGLEDGEGTTIAAFTAVNEGTASVTATINVTPTYTNGEACVGDPVSFTISVNPTPVVTEVADMTVCNGATTEEIVFEANTTDGEVTYAWTNSDPTIGLAASGTGNLPAFTATNTSNAQVTATIEVTPTYTNGGVSCEGAPMSFDITVNPAVVMDTPDNQVVCNGDNTTAVEFTTTITDGEMSYAWTGGSAIGLADGTGNTIAAFAAVNEGTAAVVATITVTPTYTNGVACVGEAVTFTITVNPTPVVTEVADMTVCDGTTTEEIVFEANTTDGEVTYAWTNSDPTIGLAASGTGNLPAFTATNTSNAQVTATIEVTPTYTNGGVSCEGAPMSFVITVNPAVVMATPANQVLCNGETTTAIEFTTTLTGGEMTYAWTCDQPEIGLAAEGTGNIAAFTAVNEGAAPVIATITVTPTYTAGGVACTGAPVSFTITVNPTPVMVEVEDITTCHDNTVNVTFATQIAEGVTYTWTNTNTAIGLAATGEGNISFTATNTTNEPVVGTIVVTPHYGDCIGETEQFTVTVFPWPSSMPEK